MALATGKGVEASQSNDPRPSPLQPILGVLANIVCQAWSLTWHSGINGPTPISTRGVVIGQGNWLLQKKKGEHPGSPSIRVHL